MRDPDLVRDTQIVQPRMGEASAPNVAGVPVTLPLRRITGALMRSTKRVSGRVSHAAGYVQIRRITCSELAIRHELSLNVQRVSSRTCQRHPLPSLTSRSFMRTSLESMGREYAAIEPVRESARTGARTHDIHTERGNGTSLRKGAVPPLNVAHASAADAMATPES